MKGAATPNFGSHARVLRALCSMTCMSPPQADRVVTCSSSGQRPSGAGSGIAGRFGPRRACPRLRHRHRSGNPTIVGVKDPPGVIPASGAIDADSDGVLRKLLYRQVQLKTFGIRAPAGPGPVGTAARVSDNPRVDRLQRNAGNLPDLFDGQSSTVECRPLRSPAKSCSWA
jgi:hypothetical protein